MRSLSVVLLTALFASITAFPMGGTLPERELRFADAIDALSIAFSSENNTAELSYLAADGWSAWETMAVENEQDPTLLESNLMMLPEGITRIRIRSTDTQLIPHPIQIPDGPAKIEVAATSAIASPKILTRKQWGADEALRFRNGGSSTAGGGDADDNGSAGNLSQREKDCEIAQVNYPEDFRTPPPESKEGSKTLRWAHRYSTEVKLLVVHHTAQSTDGETRSGIERMRALYQYHAANRGWGDIGYHYIIDDQGKIYEGKAGGDFIVGGHAYCNNVGTIGVAMMGNFDATKPPQVQMQSLQWLLKTLADRYKIDAGEAVKYHGLQLPAIVGHKQLLKTDCPGEYVWRTLDQVREHVASGKVDDPVVFPSLATTAGSAPAKRVAAPARVVKKEGFEALGGTTIEGRPGGEIIIPMLYHAGNRAVRKNQRISTLWRSNRELQFWQERDGVFKAATRTLVAPASVKTGGSVLVRLKVRLPLSRGSTTFRIGDITYTLNLSGRTARGQLLSTSQSYAAPTEAATSSPSTAATVAPATVTTSGNGIRIKLNDTVAFDTVTLRTNGTANVSSTNFAGQALVLGKDGTLCTASEGGRTIRRSILQIAPGNGQTTLTSWQKPLNRFRGTIECRVIDGKLTIINELPLEDYMAGLAEEPDTEPYEKQRAFAIAARTYAAWYMEDDHRKFPGKPYDGSDSPAEFQVYGGLMFEERNPRWVEAVRSTANKTLRFGGQLIKPPYFSSNDGRTRSPVEAGWRNFPFEAIFQSKPDPWCAGMENRGHGVGMSGCGAEAQAHEGKKAEEILQYYYPGTDVQ